MSLKDDEETRAMWDYSFELKYKIVMTRNDLTTSLTVINNCRKFHIKLNKRVKSKKVIKKYF